jgi:hypothetical protein
MCDKLSLHLFLAFNREVTDELLGDIDQGVEWPWQEPVDLALAEQRWELLSTLSELVSDR